MLSSYLKDIFEVYFRGDAREESFYSTLEAMLREYALSTGRKKIEITTLPKKTEAGNPDFRVWDGRGRITGYIEAKHPTHEDLDTIEDTEQLRRYLSTFPNVILTNFYEFRLYRNGELIKKVSITRPLVARKLRTPLPAEKEDDLLDLLDRFFSFSLPRDFNAKTLAVELAKRTRFLKDEVTINELRREESGGGGAILGFYEAFHTYLIHGITHEEFADLYSQTITYGLFAARTRAGDEFTRKSAYEFIPRTIGILREVFSFISLGDLPEPMEWIIDDIAEVLANADVKKILHEYYHGGKGRDPVVHFYETFLAEYDPRARERRGVYYTPEPVASYIVRSLDHILRERFDKEDGFATTSVTVLDPAGGTLTFPALAAALAVDNATRKYGGGVRDGIIRDHILKNFYAFELMMAPYAVGHMKMGFLLEELGYTLRKTDRFRLYLTNTLEMEDFEKTSFPFMSALSEESRLAGKVKKDTPILVIMGNPPYSGHSANRGKWISGLIDDYKQVDGKPLGEKNPKWLQDDYVKFLRFAQWKIDEEGSGCVGMITNHSYLDNPTFRGMRQSLLRSFDEIFILNLHGNSLKKEICPDGSADKNVFDIRQGVAIALFIKRGEKGGKKDAEVFYAETWGSREEKYAYLDAHDVSSTRWEKLAPRSETYFFVHRDERLYEEYEKFWKVTDIFAVNSVGVVTARDSLTIQDSPEDVWKTVLNFSRLSPEMARQSYGLGKDVRDWKVEFAQKDLLKSGPDKKNIVPILYRPFDVRYTYYTGKSRGFLCMPRSKVMRHMMRENLGLITPKQFKEEPGAFVSQNIIGHKTVSAYDINYLFPLYLYETDDGGRDMPLYEEDEKVEKKTPNLSAELLEKLKGTYGRQPSPEDIFYYIYAVAYSTVYRQKYGEFLKSDFPRIPFTADASLFKKAARLGKVLVELHLMKKTVDGPVRFQGSGDARVGKIKYDEAAGRVQINDGQYFEGVEPAVWDYHIGGYRVMEKWLKDRRGRALSLEEIKHYCNVGAALARTIRVQKEIDEIFGEIEKKTIAPEG